MGDEGEGTGGMWDGAGEMCGSVNGGERKGK
jgi:hypothetical protein